MFFVHFQWQASPLRQREVNQNSQIDQSQAGIDINRRQANQVIVDIHVRILNPKILTDSDFALISELCTIM